jgi:peptidylamidoglycolate lyase
MRIAPSAVVSVCLTVGLFAAQDPAPPATPAPASPAAPAQPAAGRGGRGGRGGTPRVIHVPDAPALPYIAVEHPLTLPPDMTTGVIASVAINSKGHVFLYQRMPVPVLEFDAQGRFVRGLREGTQTRAHSIRVDASDNIWLVDSADATVTKLSPQGEVLLTLGTKGVSGRGAEAAATPLFDVPSDVAIAPNGDIFVSQGEAGGPDPRVIHFDARGRFVNTWSLAFAEGTRSNPHAIEVDKNGLVYVADREVMRIRIFRADGTPVRELQMPTQICGLYFDRQGRLWAATGFDGQMMLINPDGSVAGFAGKAGTGLGEMGEAHTLAVAPDGAVYVVDTIGRKVEKFVKQ